MNKKIWFEVRFSIYIALILNGVIIQWIAPLQYKCDFTDVECFACGLRTAITLFLHGQFCKAYDSNRLIVLVVLVMMAILIDVYLHFTRKIEGNA